MAGRNFGREGKTRERRETKHNLAQAMAEIDAERYYHAPDEAECSIEKHELYLDSRNQLHLTMYLIDQRLVRFFLAWQSREHLGEWAERYSVCTLHGHLHEHTSGHQTPNDRRDIRPLYSEHDVSDAYDEAYNLVHNRYQLASRGGNYD